jgi:hypothetical protein
MKRAPLQKGFWIGIKQSPRKESGAQRKKERMNNT